MDRSPEVHSLIISFRVEGNESKNLTEKELRELYEKRLGEDLKRISGEHGLESGLKIVDWLYIINACVVEWPSESGMELEKTGKELAGLEYVKNVHKNSKIRFFGD